MRISSQANDYPIKQQPTLGGKPFAESDPTILSAPLAHGADGTFQTLAVMAQAVRGEIAPDNCGYQSPYIQSFAESLGSVEACFSYVAKQIKYVAHPVNAQVVQDACRTLQFRTGDCVSKSVLLASLLASLGYQVRFIAQYYDDVQMFSHVYVETCDKLGVWFGLDPVASDKPMKWTQSLPDGGFETAFDIFEV